MSKSLTRLELLDVIFRPWLKDAKRGDKIAEQRLHAILASRLRAGEISPALCDVLAEMHENAAKGEPMLAAAPSNRPPQIGRDAEIYCNVEMARSAYTCLEESRDRMEQLGRELPPPLKSEQALYAIVAKELGVSAKTIKNVYLRERKARSE